MANDAGKLASDGAGRFDVIVNEEGRKSGMAVFYSPAFLPSSLTIMSCDERREAIPPMLRTE